MRESTTAANTLARDPSRCRKGRWFSQARRSRVHRRKKAPAVRFIRTHPVDVARFQFHRFMETWTGNSDSFADTWAMRIFTLRCELLMHYGLALLTLVGMLIAHRKMPLPSLPLLNVIVFFPVVYYVCHTTSRYRHPMDPVFALLSAYALVRVAREIIEWTKDASRKKASLLADASR